MTDWLGYEDDTITLGTVPLSDEEMSESDYGSDSDKEDCGWNRHDSGLGLDRTPDEEYEQLVTQIYQENRQRRLQISDKHWIPENIQLTTSERKPQIFINSTQETPTINSVKLATITLNGELPIYFNLKVIALHLPLDDYIRFVKCEKVCQKGKTKTKTKTKKKIKKGRKDRNDFYNQCTLTINPYGQEQPNIKINLKVFPNGKISFTGVKKITDGEQALVVFLERIEKLVGPVIYLLPTVERGNTKNFRKKLKLKQSMLEYLSTQSPYSADWENFITNIKTKGKNPYPDGLELPSEIAYGLIFLEIVSTYYPLNLVIDSAGDQLRQLIQASFLSADQPIDPKREKPILEQYLAAGENKFNFKSFHTARFLITLPAWWPQPSLRKNTSLTTHVSPLALNPDQLTPYSILPDWFHPSMIEISNINTTFNYNFVLRRAVLYDLLSHKYQQYECSFESNYGGIILKYLSRVECPVHDSNTPVGCIIPEYEGCRCKQVSVLIFTNISLITGARSFHQIYEAYDFIRTVLLKEFHKIIKISKDLPHPSDQFPNIISSDKFVYLKKKFILDNPRNHFLITRNNLLTEFKA